MKIGINGRHLGPNKTGVGRYLINLLQEWKRSPRGHQFYVYTSTEQLEPEDRALFTAGSPIVHRQVSRPFGTSSFHLWYNWSLPRAMMKDGIDWFFSPDYFCPPHLSKSICRSLTIHDVSYLAHPEWFSLLYRFYGELFSKIPARTANIVFAVSKFSKSEILRFTKVEPERVIVTHEAVDSRFHPNGGDDTPQLKDLSFPYFLYVGKIFNRRHVQELIKAFERYLKISNNPNIQLVIRGKNETVPFQEIEIQIKDLNDRLGRLAILHPAFLTDNQLIALYQHARAFFYLSSYEGFGLPILESMACGVPTITVSATSIPEVAGDAAVYVDPKDIHGIADIMIRIMNDSAWVEDLRRRGLERTKMFAWSQTAEQTLKTIEASYART